MDAYAAAAYMAVPLFVMLSGVLLLDQNKTGESLKVFYKKRFLRIGGPLIFWTIFYFWWGTIVYKESLTTSKILAGLFSGSYPHLWFLYMLIGLYLAMPFLRAMVNNLDRSKFKWLIILWLVGNLSVPIINQFAPFPFNPVLFVFGGWVGYYLLGAYLSKTKVSNWKATLGLAVGLAATIFGSWWMTGTFGESKVGFFHEPLNATMILSSVSLFLFLTAVPKARINSANPKLKAVLLWVSENTLPIYLMHFFIMQLLQYGYLGVTINQATISPIIEIPLLVAATFALTAAILYPLKKIPYIKYVIG